MVENKQTKEDMTTISVSRDVYIWLESKKIHRRQGFNEVLDDMRIKEGDL